VEDGNVFCAIGAAVQKAHNSSSQSEGTVSNLTEEECISFSSL